MCKPCESRHSIRPYRAFLRSPRSTIVRRYYAITPAGREASKKLTAEWEETKDIMDKLLKVEEEA